MKTIRPVGGGGEILIRDVYDESLPATAVVVLPAKYREFWVLAGLFSFKLDAKSF